MVFAVVEAAHPPFGQGSHLASRAPALDDEPRHGIRADGEAGRNARKLAAPPLGEPEQVGVVERARAMQ